MYIGYLVIFLVMCGVYVWGCDLKPNEGEPTTIGSELIEGSVNIVASIVISIFIVLFSVFGVGVFLTFLSLLGFSMGIRI